MSVFTGIIVYLLIFWTVLFTVLPWGNRAPERQTEGDGRQRPRQSAYKEEISHNFFGI